MQGASYSWIPRTGKQLFIRCVDIMCLFGIAGYALKLPTFFNNWVYFPLWPNLGDSLFLLACVVWFVLRLRGFNVPN
jgi:hypothetical protein